MKASIAALTFILSSAAKYDCEGETLSNELQQLGLPKGFFFFCHLQIIVTFVLYLCVTCPCSFFLWWLRWGGEDGCVWVHRHVYLMCVSVCVSAHKHVCEMVKLCDLLG